MRALLLRLLSLFRRRSLDARMDEEIAAHLAMQADENVRRGMDESAAQYAALRAFGGVAQVREEHREARGFAWLDALRQDLGFARRTLAKSPGFVFAAVVILGLAIGANTALFTFFNGYVLRPIAISHADRNFEMNGIGKSFGLDTRWSVPDYREIAANHDVFSGAYAYSGRPVPVLDPQPRQALASLVSGNYFALLGGRAIMGRTILPEDDLVPGRDAVTVLSAAGWERFFNNDPNVIGKTIRVRQRVFTVVGVADPGFSGTSPVIPDAWFPLAMSEQLIPDGKPADVDHRWVQIAGLLQPALSADAAKARLTSLVLGLNGRHSTDNLVSAITLDRRDTYIAMRGDILAATIPMFVLFGLVLVIACADLANLLLARAASRQREIAVRLALGASRGRLIRQLLTESIALSLIGGALGWTIAVAAANRMQDYAFSLMLKAGFHIQPLATDWRVFAFTLAIAAAAGVVFGLAPALEATKCDLSARMKREGASLGGQARPRRITDLLVSTQVAASLILMILAGLLIRNAKFVANVDPGYDLDALVDVRFDGPDAKLIERLKTDPRFSEVTEAWRAPAYGPMDVLPGLTNGKSMPLVYNYIDDHYFATLDTPIRQGRGFRREDLRADSRVVIVSQQTARTLWPGSNPVGQTIQVSAPHPGDRYAGGTYEVIGVAGDVVNGFFFQGIDRNFIYLPAATGDARDRNLLVRIRGDHNAAIAVLRRTCAEIDRNSSCDPGTLRQASEVQIFPFLIAGQVSTAIGVLALVLTCVGLYGVVAFSVVQRTREIGIRLALGATGVGVIGLLLRRSVRQVLIGIAFGAPICLAMAKVIVSVVWMLQSFDPLTYLAIPALLIGVAMLAAYLPARRAMAVDPMVVLRDE